MDSSHFYHTLHPEHYFCPIYSINDNRWNLVWLQIWFYLYIYRKSFKLRYSFQHIKKLGKKWVESVLEHKYLKPLNKYNKRLESGGAWDLIILRILPIMPFNVLNILVGVSKIKIESYIFGTIVGFIPSNILAVYLGSFITKIF